MMPQVSIMEIHRKNIERDTFVIPISMAISSKHAHLILVSIIEVSMMSKFDMTDLGLPKIFFIKKYSLKIRRGFSSPRTNSGEKFFLR